MKKAESDKIKRYLKKTRGLIVRSVKVREDGNFKIILKKPTVTGLNQITINKLSMEDIEKYEKEHGDV